MRHLHEDLDDEVDGLWRVAVHLSSHFSNNYTNTLIHVMVYRDMGSLLLIFMK